MDRWCENSFQKMEKIRKDIDAIDDQIIHLLEKRLAIVLSIKRKTLTDKKREKTILEKIDNTTIQKIYQEIFKQCKKARRKNQSGGFLFSFKNWFK
jgi:chorismate mutase